jgi:hypothetical protein
MIHGPPVDEDSVDPHEQPTVHDARALRMVSAGLGMETARLRMETASLRSGDRTCR